MSNSQYISDPREFDASLWRQFKNGDPNALGILAELHYAALYNYGSKFSKDPEFLRDCIQELYLDLWEKRNSISETPFVKSYLFKSLRNKIFKESVRLRRFQNPEELSFDHDDSEVHIESIIVENEHLNQQSARINQILSELSNRQREIIYLRFYQGLAAEDITDIMGLGRQSVANLLYRTLKEIRARWNFVELIAFLALHFSW